MIKITLFSKDEILNDNIRKIILNSLKADKVDEDIEIQLSTGDKKKILWNLENQILVKGAINLYMIDVDGANKKEGIELAREIRKIDSLAYIVFVSGTSCEASDLMNHNIKPTHFFFKPIGTYEFIDLINEILYDSMQITKVRTKYMSGNIVVNSDYKTKSIMLSDIIDIEYSRPKSRIETVYGQVDVNMSIRKLFDQITEADNLGTFVRTHQSFIVNISNIESLDYKNLEMTMKKGRKIPIARTRKKEIQDVVNTATQGLKLTALKVRK